MVVSLGRRAASGVPVRASPKVNRSRAECSLHALLTPHHFHNQGFAFRNAQWHVAALRKNFSFRKIKMPIL